MLSHYATTLFIEKDSPIIERGVVDSGSAYLIKSGKVEVTDGTHREIRGPREFIGLRAGLYGNAPRTTTATAREPCELVEIPVHYIKQCLDESHPLIQTWIHSFSHAGYPAVPPRSIISERAINDILMANDFRKAVETDDAISFDYQPVVSMKNAGIVGFEALMRWTAQDGKRISPGEFIPVIERTPLIREVSQLAVQHACSAMAGIHRETNQKFHIAVNFTADDFLGQDFAETIVKTVADRGCAPERFIIEITERTLAQNPKQTARALHQCREKGLRTALDDFGTGQSALKYLLTLPIDELKIDKEFVQAMAEDSNSLVIVQTVIDLARKIKAQTIAEGVETEEQFNMLKGAGCDMAQGYLISTPKNESEIVEFIRNYPAAEP